MTIQLLTSCKEFTLEEEKTGLEDEVAFLLRIPQKYAGRVIGRHGETIKSIRSICFAMMMHHHKRKATIKVEPT